MNNSFRIDYFFDDVNKAVAQKPIEVLYEQLNCKHSDRGRLVNQIMEDINVTLLSNIIATHCQKIRKNSKFSFNQKFIHLKIIDRSGVNFSFQNTKLYILLVI